MNTGAQSTQMFDATIQWLMDQGLQEISIEEIARGLGKRLVAGGIPIHRISIGGMMLHPVFGAMDISWEAQSDTARYEKFPRSGFMSKEFQEAPFFHSTVNKIQFKRYHLEEGETEPTFSIFEKFRSQGVTDYVVSCHLYGREGRFLWAELPSVAPGVVSAFSTRRHGGFTDQELAYLEALTRPLAMCVKASTTHELAQTVLSTYLGNYSGRQVLDGLVERGDGKLIDCVLWYSDLRDSTALADKMPLDDFLAMVNDYFECAAGSVLDHGGEVLRFIGDAVIAIFPYEKDTRPIVDMARAAVATARETIARVDRRNVTIAESNRPPIRFGISLHVGSVMYGNIGTERRLEFSVIGPAANEVVRLEDFCKKLKTQVVASSSFNDVFPEELVLLGTHSAAGVEGGLATFTLPEFGPRPKDDAAT